MAEQKILISININDKQATKGLGSVEAATKRLNKELSDEARELAVVNENLRIAKERNKEYAKAQMQLSSTNDGFNKSLKGTSAALKQGRAQSGLNNAILLETGRLASDAGYGFTAIANNLSQVVTLFSSFAKTNGGVIASFKTLIKSLIGSGGFLIAIQLIISFGPQIFAFFERLLGFTREMREAFEGASKTVKESAGSFEIYIRTLQDTTKSQEEQNDAIKGLNKEFPNYVKQLKDAKLSLDDVAKQTEEATRITDLYREAIIKQAMSRQAQIKIEESAAKMVEIQVEREAAARDKGYESLEAAEKRLDELNAKREASKRKRLDADDVRESDRLKKIINLNQDELDEENERIDRLLEFVDIEDKERKKSGSRRGRNSKVLFRNLKADRVDYDRFIEKARKKDLSDEELTEFQKLELQKQFALDELDIQQQKFVEKEKQRRDDYIKDLQLQKNSKLEQAKSETEKKRITIEFERAKQDAIAKTAQAMQQSAESCSNAAIRIGDSYDNIINRFLEEEELQDLAGFGKALQKGNEDRLAAQESFLSSYTDSEIDRVEVAKEIEANRFSSEMANLNSIRDARIAEGQSTLEIDQQILNAEASNSEAKIALAEAEKDAKIGIANQVGNAIVTVAGEGSTVGKAASIAMAIMNTKEAFTAALGAKPYGPWNIAQAAATLAMGFKQVKDIMAVKIPGKEPASGGDGGGLTIQAPDFNVVGASQTSQLAETVAGQQAKPVKAFVVGKDISTQQELDRNTTNTASFG
jgi:hypothetical protein